MTPHPTGPRAAHVPQARGHCQTTTRPKVCEASSKARTSSSIRAPPRPKVAAHTDCCPQPRPPGAVEEPLAQRGAYGPTLHHLSRQINGNETAEENFWGPQMALLGPMKTNGTSGAHEVLYNRILVPSLFYVYYHSKRATLKHANDSRSRSVQCKTLDSLVMQQLSYHLTHPECQNFDQLKIKQYW